jgi:hypothetical protein
MNIRLYFALKLSRLQSVVGVNSCLYFCVSDHAHFTPAITRRTVITTVSYFWIHLIELLAFALLSNTALGYLRQNTRKGSLVWFFYIHASIPFIVWLRVLFGFSWQIIPFTLACAVLGQLSGGWMRRRYNP